MMWRMLAAGAALLAVCAVPGSAATAQPQPQQAKQSQLPPSQARSGAAAHAFLMRGLMGMSPAMGELAQKIEQRGVPTTIAGHADWQRLAEAASDSYKRGQVRSIIIIGHSMGGAAALSMAERLGREQIPVQLVVTIDPYMPPVAPTNVRKLVNLYIPNGVGSQIAGAADFRGNLQNIADTANGHFTIVRAHESAVIGYVMAAARPPSAKLEPPPGTAQPARTR